MLNFQIRVKNARGLNMAFGGIVAKIRDWRALWPAVINQLNKAEGRAYQTQGALTATGEWEALSDKYAQAKERKYPGQLIETASGRARAALTGHTADTIEELHPLFMRWGARILTKNGRWDILTLQQTGTKKMPARRLMDFTDEDRAIIQKQIQREAVNFSRRLGFKVIAASGGDVSQFSLSEIRQAGVQFLNQGAPLMTLGSDLF